MTWNYQSGHLSSRDENLSKEHFAFVDNKPSASALNNAAMKQPIYNNKYTSIGNYSRGIC